MVMPNYYPAAALAPATASHIASIGPNILQGYSMGRTERLDDERRNYLREAGNLASSGNISGAVGAAFRGGDPTTAINMSNWDTGRRIQALSTIREGAARVQTKEQWDALIGAVERAFGPEMVQNYRDFNSRPAAMTALEQATAQLRQSEADVAAQKAAAAEREARLNEWMFGQFGFGAPSATAAPTAAAAQSAFSMPSSVMPLPQPSAVPGVSVMPTGGAAPPAPAMAPPAPPPNAPERLIPGVLPPLPAPPPEEQPSQSWTVPQFPNIGRAIRDAIVPAAQGQTLPPAAPAQPPAQFAQAPAAPVAPAQPAAPPTSLPPQFGDVTAPGGTLPSSMLIGGLTGPPAAPATPQQAPAQPQTMAGTIAAMNPSQRNAAMLLLMKRDYAGLAKMIEGITPGTEATDREFAKEYASWTAGGGYADVQRQLVQLGSVNRALEEGGNITGPVVGSLPDFVNRFINPAAVANRQRVEEVVQRSLRQVLGAQFTEREAENLVKRAYDPALPQAENAQRVRLLLGHVAAAAEAKQSASQYFQRHGTLRGWQGRQYTLSDFEALLDPQSAAPPPGGQQQGAQPDAGGGTNLPTLTPDQARQLPPGTQFRGTDGNTYRVPMQTQPQHQTMTGR